MRMNKYFKTDSKKKLIKITVLIYNFETFNKVMQNVSQAKCQQRADGKDSDQKLATLPLWGLKKKGMQQGKKHQFSEIPTIAQEKHNTSLKVRKHFQYASFCRFVNSTLERIQFEGKRDQKEKKKKKLDCLSSQDLSLMALNGIVL